MVVTEYCASGNLQKFLRNSKVINKSDTSQSQSPKIYSTLSYHKLLKIAVEVSSGMLYLSKKKVQLHIIIVRSYRDMPC